MTNKRQPRGGIPPNWHICHSAAETCAPLPCTHGHAHACMRGWAGRSAAGLGGTCHTGRPQRHVLLERERMRACVLCARAVGCGGVGCGGSGGSNTNGIFSYGTQPTARDKILVRPTTSATFGHNLTPNSLWLAASPRFVRVELSCQLVAESGSWRGATREPLSATSAIQVRQSASLGWGSGEKGTSGLSRSLSCFGFVELSLLLKKTF